MSGLLALFAALASAPAVAGGSGGTSNNPAPETSAGSDDVEGIPLVFAPRSNGFEIEIEATRLEVVLRRARGQGTVQIRATSSPDRVSVTFRGRFQIRLDSRAIARGDVRVRYFGERSAARVIHRGRGVVLLQR